MSPDLATSISEAPQGDSYGRSTGHLVLPSGQHIAVFQGDDRLASALVAAWWELWQKEFNK